MTNEEREANQGRGGDSVSNSMILLVEDDTDLASIIKRFLGSEGHEVVAVGSAEEAYDVLSHRSFELMIFDINLPGADGIELCDNLRRASSVPVIFTSASVGDSSRALALEKGGDAYLTKPFSLRELRAQINAILKRIQRDASGDVGHGIEVDSRMRRICKNGEPVELSPKEYELAMTLIRNSGRALSRDHLLETVWGAFSEVEPQTLAVHIRWLRSKLEDDPSRPKAFVTVRGYGYRYDLDGSQ